MDICRCGRPFKAAATVEPLESNVQAWLDWLERALSSSFPARVDEVSACTLPVALTHLSVDGAFRIIEAMGLCAKPGTSIRAARGMVSTPRALGAVMARGIERLREIEAEPGSVQRFAPVANQVGLADIARDFAASEDQTLASWLLSGMQVLEPGPTRAGSRPTGQLTLFL